MITAARDGPRPRTGRRPRLAGVLTVGALLVVHAYLASIYGPLEAISGTLTSIQTDLVEAERVFEVLDTDADVKDLPDAVPLATVAGRVTFRSV